VLPDRDTSPEDSIVEGNSVPVAESYPNVNSTAANANVDLVLQHRSLGTLGMIAYARQHRLPYR
jgi:hypothetical protein